MRFGMKLPHRGSCCVRDVGVRWEVLSNYWFIDVVPLGSFGYWSDCCYESNVIGIGLYLIVWGWDMVEVGFDGVWNYGVSHGWRDRLIIWSLAWWFVRVLDVGDVW